MQLLKKISLYRKSYLFLGSLFLFFPLLAEVQPSIEKRLSALEAYVVDHSQLKPDLAFSNVFFMTGSYLCWRPYEEGLSYATRATNEATEFQETVYNLKFEWDTGFRVGMGYRMPYDAWELGVNYTRLYSHLLGPKQEESGLSFLESQWFVISDISYPFIKASLKIGLNVLDGEISRCFQATKHLSLKPHVGIRGLWINQHLAVSCEKVSQTYISTHSKGSGGRAGIDTEWEFFPHWIFYGNVGGSLLCSRFTIKESKRLIPLVVRGKDILSTTLTPTVDIALGLGWEYSFARKAALLLRAGWEFNDFCNQNKMTGYGQVAHISYSEDLTYQGLTVSARLDF